jgi:hypothetical protein
MGIVGKFSRVVFPTPLSFSSYISGFFKLVVTYHWGTIDSQKGKSADTVDRIQPCILAQLPCKMQSSNG